MISKTERLIMTAPYGSTMYCKTEERAKAARVLCRQLGRTDIDIFVPVWVNSEAPTYTGHDETVTFTPTDWVTRLLTEGKK